MTDLLSQLQSATDGSRELSDQMLLACGWTYGYDEGLSVWLWRTPAGEIHSPHAPLEDPTRDLQDAVSLAGDDWLLINSSPSQNQCHAVMKPNAPGPEGWGATPALALCIAIIKAHESKAEAA